MTEITRELCWKPIGEYDNCHRLEGHTRRCLATCGDCKEGRCHKPVRPPKPGVGDPLCGCARHADSLLALWWDGEDDQDVAEEGADVSH